MGLGNADGWLGDDWWLTLVNARVGPAALAAGVRLDPRFSFETAPLQGAAATLQQWAGRGYFTPSFGGLDAQDSMVTFFQGHTAMQLRLQHRELANPLADAAARACRWGSSRSPVRAQGARRLSP